MISPPPLRKGDKIGLISTARKIRKKDLKPAIDLFRSWGLKVKLAPNLFSEENQFAGTDQQRLSDIQGFIDDPAIKAIICVKGGYGTVRIIDDIQFIALAKNPKWIAGYSDVTVLLNRLHKLGMESLHAPMPAGFPDNSKKSLDSLRQALFGELREISTEAHPLNRRGTARGKLIGGNLSVLYSQLGSPTALNTDGHILFLEDLDEYLYHIDRMMMNLRRNGYFENLQGLIIGGMTAMNDNKIPFGESAEQIIARITASYDFPVCFGFPAGHIPHNTTLIMGRSCELEVGEQVKLKFRHGPS